MAVSERIFVYSMVQGKGKRKRQCKAGGFAHPLTRRVLAGLAPLARPTALGKLAVTRTLTAVAGHGGARLSRGMRTALGLAPHRPAGRWTNT